MRKSKAYGRRATRSRILLADDDLEMRRMLAQALRPDGYEVVEAASGIELLDALASQLLNADAEPFELIISDLRMPGVDGLSVLAGLRDSDWTTPFILITGFGGSVVESEAIRKGAAAVFDKPFDLDALRVAVCALLLTGSHPDGGDGSAEIGGEG